MRVNKFSYAVLLPIYQKDSPELAKMALDSIINQSFNDFELLILCDGELTDDLDKVVDKYLDRENVKRLNLPKRGLGLTLKSGVLSTTADIVFRCDSDDYQLSNRFQRQKELFEENPTLSITSSYILEEDLLNGIKETAKSLKKIPIKNIELYSFFRNPINHNSSAFKRKDVIECGNYGSGRMEDYRLWVRMIKKNKKIINTDQILTHAHSGENFVKKNWEGLFYCGVAFVFKSSPNYIFTIESICSFFEVIN